MLQAGLRVVEHQGITVTVIPTAKALIGYGQSTRRAIRSTADRGGNALVVIVAVVKTRFAAQFKVNLAVRLAFFGHNVD